jgi:hypothetical protein
MAWTFSIDYETKDGDGDVRYGSTAVAAETCRDALVRFLDEHPGSDVREMRRVRHD